MLFDDCRHCLWVLGNAATLRGSGSVWTELVQDAKDRQCFFDWRDGTGVSTPITLPMPEPAGAPVIIQCKEDGRAATASF
jgi:senataxin